MKISLIKGDPNGEPNYPKHDLLMIQAENSIEELMIQEVIIEIEALVAEIEGRGGYANG